MIARRYGMFIHYGMNTFLDQEWTDGTDGPDGYAPSAINTDQWARVAQEAGMKYVILTTKHHEGFCLWPTKHTRHSVASSGNRTDVVGALADSCRKYDLKLGLYYSLWDRNWSDGAMRALSPPALTPDASKQYVDYMLKQLEELLTQYGPVCELWLDGGWVQPREFWKIPEVYALVKRIQPGCAVGVNWSIGHPDNIDTYWPDRPLSELIDTQRQPGEPAGLLPEHQREGYPFRYFPSDFRLGDPYLPAENDPKRFTHDGESYYLPFEATVCLNDRWFYSPSDKGLQSVAELAGIYEKATAQDNVLILNSPPDRNGLMSTPNRNRLIELRKELDI